MEARSAFLSRLRAALKREVEKSCDPEGIAEGVGQSLRGETVTRQYERRKLPGSEDFGMVEVRRVVTSTPDSRLRGLEILEGIFSQEGSSLPVLNKFAVPEARFNIFEEAGPPRVLTVGDERE